MYLMICRRDSANSGCISSFETNSRVFASSGVTLGVEAALTLRSIVMVFPRLGAYPVILTTAFSGFLFEIDVRRVRLHAEVSCSLSLQTRNISREPKFGRINDPAFASAIRARNAEALPPEFKDQVSNSTKLRNLYLLDLDHCSGCVGVKTALRRLSGSSFCSANARRSAPIAPAPIVFSDSSFLEILRISRRLLATEAGPCPSWAKSTRQGFILQLDRAWRSLTSFEANR